MRHILPILGLLVGAFATTNADERDALCPPAFPGIFVVTSTHTLGLCKPGALTKTYRVALGRGGTGKRKQGDNKTPLGSYLLGVPRASDRFFTFIPVGYPTEEQRRNGFTGGDIGVHGPPRRLAWLGNMTTMFDWTEGCIAVGTEKAISEIADWVRRTNSDRVVIR